MRLAFIGWGAIARTAAGLLSDSPVEIVALARRGRNAPIDLPAGARVITEPGELAELSPDLVAEAASRDSVLQWGPASLECGADFIVSSVSAFADPDVLELLRRTAADRGAQVHIQPGALAGVDALAAAQCIGLDAVEHRIVKPPRAWRDTPAEELCPLDELTMAQEFFTANASEAALAFPKNANVAMTSALAGVGPDLTMITLVADPDASTNRHEITAHGAFGRLDVVVSNNPLPANPKTSTMAALSLARAIRNHTNAIVI